MGRLVYWMNVSTDLRIEHAPDEHGGGSWMSIGDELHAEFNRRARALALSVEGRVIYETMEAYWPQAATDDTQPAVMREYGEIWTSSPKVLVSRTRTSADHNTRIIGSGGEDAMEQLARIKAETDGDIGIGGANLATQALRAGLLDELLLFMHPALLGSGRPLFDEPCPPLQLRLLEHERYAGGVMLLRYGIEG